MEASPRRPEVYIAWRFAVNGSLANACPLTHVAFWVEKDDGFSMDQFVSSRLGQVELSCSAHIGAGLLDNVEASLISRRRDRFEHTRLQHSVTKHTPSTAPGSRSDDDSPLPVNPSRGPRLQGEER